MKRIPSGWAATCEDIANAIRQLREIKSAKQALEASKRLAVHIEALKCHDMHHMPSEYHRIDQPCGPRNRVVELARALQDYLEREEPRRSARMGRASK